MNFVYFVVDNLPHEKTSQTSFHLKGVELLRDGEIIATPGDIKITSLPFFYFCTVQTGFRKIEFRMKNTPPARIICNAGYLKTGDYLVNTPEGEIILPFNAMNGLWTLDKNRPDLITHQDFISRAFTLVRPVKGNNRNAPMN